MSIKKFSLIFSYHYQSKDFKKIKKSIKFVIKSLMFDRRFYILNDLINNFIVEKKVKFGG